MKLKVYRLFYWFNCLFNFNLKCFHFIFRLTVGKENITQEQDIKVLNKNASAEHMLILADHGPNLDALKVILSSEKSLIIADHGPNLDALKVSCLQKKC